MMGLSLITPFFPTFAIEKGVSQGIMGLIISSNPIGSFIAAPILGRLINNVFIIYITKSNRHKFMILGMSLQAIGQFIYVILKWVDNVNLFIVVASAGRFIEGLGTGCFLTPYFAFIPLLFPD